MNDIETTAERTSRSRFPELTETEIAALRESLSGLRYGVVQIIVQDGVIVQIDRTEKRRLRNGGKTPT